MASFLPLLNICLSTYWVLNPGGMGRRHVGKEGEKACKQKKYAYNSLFLSLPLASWRALEYQAGSLMNSFAYPVNGKKVFNFKQKL